MTFTINTLAPPLSGQVSFSLAGCPPLSTCTFGSTTVQAGTANTLTVVTTASSLTVPSPAARRMPPFGWPERQKVARNLCMVLLAGLFVILVAGRGKHRRIVARVPMVVALLLVVFGVLSCGSGDTSDPAVTIPGTTAGAYPLVITATGSGNTTATTTVNITVD
jgi:hypothetical protein